jgi:hypothetical protein
VCFQCACVWVLVCERGRIRCELCERLGAAGCCVIPSRGAGRAPTERHLSTWCVLLIPPTCSQQPGCRTAPFHRLIGRPSMHVPAIYAGCVGCGGPTWCGCMYTMYPPMRCADPAGQRRMMLAVYVGRRTLAACIPTVHHSRSRLQPPCWTRIPASCTPRLGTGRCRVCVMVYTSVSCLLVATRGSYAAAAAAAGRSTSYCMLRGWVGGCWQCQRCERWGNVGLTQGGGGVGRQHEHMLLHMLWHMTLSAGLLILGSA